MLTRSQRRAQGEEEKAEGDRFEEGRADKEGEKEIDFVLCNIHQVSCLKKQKKNIIRN